MEPREHFLKLSSGGALTSRRRKSKRLNRQSDKRKRLDLEYSRLRKIFLTDNPRCAVFPSMRSDQIHHKKKRGKNYLNVSTWLAVSSRGHRWIHDNPAEAKLKGFTEDSWK